MKWEQHQRVPFFGLTPTKIDGPPPQPRHSVQVDLDAALRKTASLVNVWLAARAFDTLPYTGGVWDSWPAKETAALRIMAAEETVARAVLQREDLEARR